MKDLRVKVKQVELQVRDEGKGVAIIFLHFSGANLMMWQRVLPFFQERYRLIMVDMRGHGKSDKPESGYHIDEMASDIMGIMYHLKLEQAFIVGSSLGAEVGLSIAANYPSKVIGLVCDGALSSEFGPYGTWEGSEAEFAEHISRQLEKMRNTPDTIYPSVGALVEDSRKILEKYGLWNEVVEEVERYGATRIAEGKYRKSLSKKAMADYMEGYFRCRFEDYYRKVKCPILMLPGEDLLQNEREKAAMEGLRGLAEQAEIVEVERWEHPYGWMLNPDGVCKTIMRFLDRIEKTSGIYH